MLEQLLKQQNELLTELIATIRALKPPAPPTLNMVFPLEEFAGFDWGQIGARVVASDRQGPTIIERDGAQYKRRSPSNKFTPGIWYSRCTGEGADGKNQYERLVAFMEIKDDAIEPLSPKVEQLLSSNAKAKTPEVQKPASQPASDHQAALKLQAPTPKQQLVKAIDEQFKELSWKDGRHRKFLIEELSVNGTEWEHKSWYADLLMASSEQQLEALLAKLKTYGKPTEKIYPMNVTAFWEEARGITVGGHRAFDDATIKWFIKRHTDEAGKTNWASALAALKNEAANMASGKAKAA